MTDTPKSETFQYQFDVEGMTCAACVANVEEVLSKVPGVLDISVNLATESASITSSEPIPLNKLARSVNKMGYKLEPQGGTSLIDRQQRGIATWRKLLALQITFGVPLLVYAMLEMFHILPPITHLLNISIQFSLATILVVSGAGYYRRGFKHLFMAVPNMDSLVALGTGSAYIYSLISSINLILELDIQGFETLYYEAAGTILLFITLGKWLEAVARGKTTEALTGLMEQMPKAATVYREETWVSVPLDQVKRGDRIRVAPHTRIPVDGYVVSGAGSVDESSMSGEALPVEKAQGDKVIGASMNLQASLEIQATRIGRESLFGQIIKLVEEAQTKKPEIQRMVDKIAAVFVPIVLALALISGTVWLLLGYGITFAVNVMVSVMIIACPCALGLATPTALVVASGMAARKGILIKSVDAFQQLSQVDTIIFDKTGTLTQAKIQVNDIYPTENPQYLRAGMGLEVHSQHPLAKPLLEHGNILGLAPFVFDDVQEIPGLGLTGKYGNQVYRISKLSTEDALEPKFLARLISWLDEGQIVSGVYKEDLLMGMIAFSDTIKPESGSVIKTLNEAGINVVLATGDKLKPALELGQKLGIEHIHAEILPADKHGLVEEYQSGGTTVAMLGDGINDSPALAAANVGISFRGSTDIAMNAADIILMNETLHSLVSAQKLARATLQKIKQNLFWAFFYNLVGIPIAMGLLYPLTGTLLNPMFAGMAMAFSSVSVVSNTLLLRRQKL